ncbi:hypothetical protein F4Z99_18800 [Candidatus Poribacteria bacterium]|nr:hypothetical protein [Candidatus Poribacteria bacterium]MYA99176.1 hypothetical protein [Candidatus Poribacteria bacterium]
MFCSGFGIEPVQAIHFARQQSVASVDVGNINAQHFATQRGVQSPQPGAVVKRIDSQVTGIARVNTHHDEFGEIAIEQKACQNGLVFRCTCDDLVLLESEFGGSR